MKIIVTQPFAGGGRTWKKGKRYDVSDETAARFIAAGHAEPAFDALVSELAEAGAGLVITRDTDPHLLAAAKRGKLMLHRPRAKGAAA